MSVSKDDCGYLVHISFRTTEAPYITAAWPPLIDKAFKRFICDHIIQCYVQMLDAMTEFITMLQWLPHILYDIIRISTLAFEFRIIGEQPEDEDPRLGFHNASLNWPQMMGPVAKRWKSICVQPHLHTIPLNASATPQHLLPTPSGPKWEKFPSIFCQLVCRVAPVAFVDLWDNLTSTRAHLALER